MYIFSFFNIENATNIVSLNILTSRKITRGIAIIAVLVINSTWCRRSIKYSPLALKEHVTFITYTCQPSRTKSSALSTQSLRRENCTQPSSNFTYFLPGKHVETIPFTFIYWKRIVSPIGVDFSSDSPCLFGAIKFSLSQYFSLGIDYLFTWNIWWNLIYLEPGADFDSNWKKKKKRYAMEGRRLVASVCMRSRPCAAGLYGSQLRVGEARRTEAACTRKRCKNNY